MLVQKQPFLKLLVPSLITLKHNFKMSTRYKELCVVMDLRVNCSYKILKHSFNLHAASLQ